jgi:hypothetical protein
MCHFLTSHIQNVFDYSTNASILVENYKFSIAGYTVYIVFGSGTNPGEI